MASILDSRLEGHGFEIRLVLDGNGNGVKAIPGLIPAPNPGSLNNTYSVVSGLIQTEVLLKHFEF